MWKTQVGKCRLLILPPELSHAFPLLSAALKGTSTSSSLSGKVEGGKTAAKRLSISLCWGRFKAWLGLPWRHICLMINPQKLCSGRQQSFVAGEGPRESPWGPQQFWDCGAPWSLAEPCLPGGFIAHHVPSLHWCSVFLRAVRWHSVCLNKCLSPAQDQRE